MLLSTLVSLLINVCLLSHVESSGLQTVVTITFLLSPVYLPHEDLYFFILSGVPVSVFLNYCLGVLSCHLQDSLKHIS